MLWQSLKKKAWGDLSFIQSLQWRHNGLDSVSNHQHHHCLLSRLFGRRSKKTSKLHVTGLCAGNSPGTGEFPAQMTSYAENVSIWWRHHVMRVCDEPKLQRFYFRFRNFMCDLNPRFVLCTTRVACNSMIKLNKVIKWNHFPRYWPFMRGIHWSPVVPLQRPVARSFDAFFDLCLNRRLNKQSRRRWFETPSRSLWRPYNGKGVRISVIIFYCFMWM